VAQVLEVLEQSGCSISQLGNNPTWDHARATLHIGSFATGSATRIITPGAMAKDLARFDP
jgi:hypothetical protein